MKPYREGEKMNQADKLQQAVDILKSLDCPKAILEALWVFGLTVSHDDIKLQNWIAPGGIVEGEVIEESLEESK